MKALFSIAFSLLTLFSSLNWAVSTHFCQEELSNLSLFGKAESCHDQHDHQALMMDCPVHGQMPMSPEKETKDDCCKDHSFKVDGQDLEVTVPQISIDIVFPVILAVLNDAVQPMPVIERTTEIALANHSPPDTQERLSLIQVYRL